MTTLVTQPERPASLSPESRHWHMPAHLSSSAVPTSQEKALSGPDRISVPSISSAFEPCQHTCSASSLGGTFGAVASPRAADCGHVTPAAPRRQQPPPYPSSCQCSVSFAFRRQHRNTTIRSTWFLLLRWCLALLRRSRSHTVDAVATVSSTEAALHLPVYLRSSVLVPLTAGAARSPFRSLAT